MDGCHGGLAGAEGDHSHVAWQGDFHGSGIPLLTLRGYVQQPGNQGAVFQAEVLAADFQPSLHGGHGTALLRKPAVFHLQFDLRIRREGHFRHSLVVLLVVPWRKGDGRPIGQDGGDGVSGIDCQGRGLGAAGPVLELVDGFPGHRTGMGVRKYLGAAPGTGDAFQHGQGVKGHNRQIRVAVIHQRLGGPGGNGAGEKTEGKERSQRPSDAAEKGGQGPFPPLPDKKPGNHPHSPQGSQPGQAHIGHGAEDAEVGKIIGQSPHAGVQPAKLPVSGPDCQAQPGKGGDESQGQIGPPGKMVGGGGGQDGQRQGQAHEKPISENVVAGVKDGADEPSAGGEPERRRDAKA